MRMESINQLEEELARLDREWGVKRATFLVRGKDGKLGEPTGANLVPRVILMVGSVVAMAFFSATSLSPFFAFACLIPFSVATFQLISGAAKSDAFDRSQSEHEGLRSAVIRKLEQARLNDGSR